MKLKSILLILLLLFAVRVGQMWSEEEIGVPEPYYQSVTQVYGTDNLTAYLAQWEWAREYEANVFDCTEMSALLECLLENEGFHSIIVIGKYEDISHAWLEVETSPKQYAIVEATALVVVEADNYTPIYRHEDIYEAVEISYTAFDWWEE